MSEFNSCAKLKNTKDYKDMEKIYNEKLENGQDPFDMIFKMQTQLQEKLAEKYPKYNRKPSDLKTMGDILEWIRGNEDAINDEFRELYTSLGGMSNGEKKASAVWKRWKAAHGKMVDKKFDEMSDDDITEMKFESLDIFFFLINIMLSLRIDSKELAILYMLKSKENFARQDRNY